VRTYNLETVLVTGDQGQDGSILCESLISQGFKVVGVGRRRLDDHSLRDRRLANLGSRFEHRICDLRDSSVVHELVSTVKPNIIYNLAAMSSPAESWDNPGGTLQNDTLSFLNLLDSVRFNCPSAQVVQACTAAIFHTSHDPINENSPVKIVNPYAAAKYTALTISHQYRQRYNLQISNAIMFNHESEWRPESFVTRKISKAVARIKHGLQDTLNLWTLDPIRDWGWASEYMDAFLALGQLESQADVILATGHGASIREFTQVAFQAAGLDADEFVRTQDSPMNSGVDISIGDAALAKELLGWKAKVHWQEIAHRMVSHDLQQIP
jgi:GDPmannose 4,6-dehydratase